MSVEIAVDYCPDAPDQIELKVIINDLMNFSFFATKGEIIDMIISLEKAVHDMRD